MFDRQMLNCINSVLHFNSNNLANYSVRRDIFYYCKGFIDCSLEMGNISMGFYSDIINKLVQFRDYRRHNNV